MDENQRVEFIRDFVNVIHWLRSIDGPCTDSHLVLDQEVGTPNGHHTVMWDGETIH